MHCCKRASERSVSRKEYDLARGTNEPHRRDLSRHGNKVTEQRLLTSGDHRGRESQRKTIRHVRASMLLRESALLSNVASYVAHK